MGTSTQRITQQPLVKRNVKVTVPPIARGGGGTRGVGGQGTYIHPDGHHKTDQGLQAVKDSITDAQN